jgi:hypothetical protein
VTGRQVRAKEYILAEKTRGRKTNITLPKTLEAREIG